MGVARLLHGTVRFVNCSVRFVNVTARFMNELAPCVMIFSHNIKKYLKKRYGVFFHYDLMPGKSLCPMTTYSVARWGFLNIILGEGVQMVNFISFSILLFEL